MMAAGMFDGASLLPYSIDFSALADGALPSGWTGSTWAIASGKAVNTPTLGAELWDAGASIFASGTYNWAPSGTNLIENDVNELKVTYVDNAGGALDFLRDSSDLSVDLTPGTFYQWSYNARVNPGFSVSPLVHDGVNFVLGTAVTATSKIAGVVDHLKTASLGFARFSGMTAGSIIWVDDLSLKAKTGLMAIRNTGRKEQNITGTYTTLRVGTFMGVLANVAPDFSAGICAATNGSVFWAWKWIGSTWTLLVNVSGGPTTNLPQIKTVRSGVNLLADFYQNGVQQGTQKTISDTQIVDNTYVGLLSTFSGNTIATFTAVAN